MGGIPRMLAIMASIILTVIGLAFLAVYITGAFSGTKAAEASTQLSTIISKVQGAYANRPTFTGLAETVAVQGGIFPDNMIDTTNNTAFDPWNGAVTVEAGSTPTEFTVEFDDVPPHACQTLAMSYNSTNLVSLTVNGNSMTLPVVLNTALTTDCTTNSTLIWTMN